ncbi:unnamed protein product [Protopolystoma xenopodis]|uniref:Uncharacterized protein n=1 Tax=Protopolystoma xenopodis TaxID=117903 RepID=A0A3S5AIU5_9PLAT|nr:unnamed protein product [Protopolystoma xenopodis]
MALPFQLAEMLREPRLQPQAAPHLLTTCHFATLPALPTLVPGPCPGPAETGPTVSPQSASGEAGGTSLANHLLACSNYTVLARRQTRPGPSAAAHPTGLFFTGLLPPPSVPSAPEGPPIANDVGLTTSSSPLSRGCQSPGRTADQPHQHRLQQQSVMPMLPSAECLTGLVNGQAYQLAAVMQSAQLAAALQHQQGLMAAVVAAANGLAGPPPPPPAPLARLPPAGLTHLLKPPATLHDLHLHGQMPFFPGHPPLQHRPPQHHSHYHQHQHPHQQQPIHPHQHQHQLHPHHVVPNGSQTAVFAHHFSVLPGDTAAINTHPRMQADLTAFSLGVSKT